MEGCMEGITLTVMNIRELLMGYFKGSCVDKLTSSGNINLIKDYRYTSQQHLYERRELELQDKSILVLGDLKLFTLYKNPNKLVFYSILERSKELKEVKTGIETFMDEFLAGVEKVYITKPKADVTKIIDDSELVAQTRPRTAEDSQANSIDVRLRDYFYARGVTMTVPIIQSRPNIEWTEEAVF